LFHCFPVKSGTRSSIKTFCRCRNCKAKRETVDQANAAGVNGTTPFNKPGTVGFSGFGYMPSTSKINVPAETRQQEPMDEIDAVVEIDSSSGVKPVRPYKLFQELTTEKKQDWLNDVFHDAVDCVDGPGA
jgi:hypothetical protein